MSDELDSDVIAFVEDVVGAMGLTLAIEREETPDNIRFNLTGDGAEVLLKRQGEALDALQVIVNTAFRRELNDDRSFTVDCLDYRKGKDEELRQMTRFTMERVKTNRTQQEMGPLNPYARRIVHMTVAEDPALASESIGDAFLKTVIISLRK